MPIMQQKLVILIARKRFPQLLQGPLRSRMFGDIVPKNVVSGDVRKCSRLHWSKFV